jgi:hypothetical protein
MTVDAGIVFLDHRGPVTLGVVAVGEFEDVPGAKRDAVATALASFLQNVDDASRNLDFGGIKRGPPIFHGLFSVVPVLKGSCSLGKAAVKPSPE